MVEVFIDESGNQGSQGKYFIIAAVVCPTNRTRFRLKRIFKKACLKYSKEDAPLPEIKSNALGFEQLQELLNKMALRPDYSLFILVADKQHLKTNLDHNLYYNYLSGVLIQRILSKYADDVRITFDARDVKQTSLTSIADYLKIKAAIDWGFKYTLQVARKDSRTVFCLQAADLVAHVAYKKYSADGNHLFGLLRPRIEKLVAFPRGKFGT